LKREIDRGSIVGQHRVEKGGEGFEGKNRWVREEEATYWAMSSREEKERKEPEKTSEFFPKHDYRLLLIRFFRCVFLLIVTSGLRRETRDTIRLQRLLRKL